MYPPFVMLLVVAIVFLGFALIPKRPAVAKGKEKPRFERVAQGTRSPMTIVPRDNHAAASTLVSSANVAGSNTSAVSVQQVFGTTGRLQ